MRVRVLPIVKRLVMIIIVTDRSYIIISLLGFRIFIQYYVYNIVYTRTQ